MFTMLAASVKASLAASTGPLLHFDGANGSTAIIDSHGGSSWLRAGTAAISTAQSKFGGASLDVSGNLVATTNMGGTLGANFTVEGWAFNTGTPRGLFQLQLDGSASSLALGWDGTSVWELYHLGVVTQSAALTVPAGWFHWAVWRTGGVIRVAIGGTIRITVTDAGSFAAFPSMYIGCYFDTPYPWVGYIDEVRITLTTAQYGTANFTPPTTAFT